MHADLNIVWELVLTGIMHILPSRLESVNQRFFGHYPTEKTKSGVMLWDKKKPTGKPAGIFIQR
ncbi:MAG: hypothetical protein CL942_00885 [Desulfovibrio sp.]|nr:hypothetical protein [Desulfovibrio sp.]